MQLYPELGVCRACVEEARDGRMAARLDFGNGAVLEVEQVAEEAEARSTVPSAAGARASKRPRRGRAKVEVATCHTTLGSLRMLVYEQTGIHPRNAAIYQAGRLLEGDQRTLRELRVTKDEAFKVYNKREVDDDEDIADLLAAGSMRAGAAAKERERGFAGTKLTGGGTLKP